MQSAVKLYYLRYSEAKTYLFALLFVAGNIIFPQMSHLVPGGGLVWLPIYFFTLVGAYKYGITVGLLTATLSPLINSLAFGMPPMAVLPIILIKSCLLAFAAAIIAGKTQKVTLVTLLAVVLGYQVVGTLIEWILVGDFRVAIQDFRIGIPGMLVQVLGGYALLKAIRNI